MTKRADRKARAAMRNAQRAAENTMSVAEVIDPAEAKRMAIRVERERKARAERRRARQLNEAHRDPPPDANVQASQIAAAKQRELAAGLEAKARLRNSVGDEARRKRKEFLDEARRLDIKAAADRERQLELHWRAMADREITSTAAARGEKLEESAVEVAHWARDEHGAIVHVDGLPVLTSERATVRRRKNGLDWLRDKKRITEEQFRIGERAGAVWALAAQAAEPGRAEEGGTGGRSRAPAGPADWRLAAFLARKKMEVSVLEKLPGAEGVEILRLLEAVCYRGETVRDVAKGDDWQAARAEERLKIGLALLRYGFMRRLEPA